MNASVSVLYAVLYVVYDIFMIHADIVKYIWQAFWPFEIALMHNIMLSPFILDFCFAESFNSPTSVSKQLPVVFCFHT